MSFSGSPIPIVDIGALGSSRADSDRIATDVRRACRETGFFYVVGHGVSSAVQETLERLARQFFALDLDTKLSIRMDHGGRAWRGYFPVGGELTSGRPDQKEGLYFGAELGDDHPKVLSRTPLHGRNLFPANLPGFRASVLEYIDAMTRLGHRLMEAVALSLDLTPDYFVTRYTGDPIVLFRIFNYPPLSPPFAGQEPWSVGEHTDYGLLTIIRQDDSGGLQVKSSAGWIDATPVPGAFVCNIGDMLDRMTGGYYRSTPHRVRNLSGRDRLSFPFFFDPGWDAEVRSIEPGAAIRDDRDERWDRRSVHEFHGTYGDYLLGKVSRVFPHLARTTSSDSRGGERCPPGEP